MNQATEQIIRELLKSEKAWDQKTRLLRFDWVLSQYFNVRERRWLDELYFPRMGRAYRMIETWGIFPGCEFYDFEYEPGKFARWMDWAEQAEMVQERLDGYFERLWWSANWAYEEITKEQILALGVAPSLVPSKPGQPSLF